MIGVVLTGMGNGGLIEAEVVEIGASPELVAADLVERLLRAGGELITVLLGDGAAPGPLAAEVGA